MERAEPKGFRNRAAAPLRASGILSRLAAAELAGRGVDPRPLLDGAGIAPEFLADPDCRLLVSEQAAFLDGHESPARRADGMGGLLDALREELQSEAPGG